MADESAGLERRDCNVANPAERQEFERLSLATLKQRGHRVTMPRLQVVRVLGETNQALSAYQIHERIVKGGGRIDVVTVYRILATLEEAGLAHHIASVNGYIPCRQAGEHGIQQRLVCRQCGCVIETDVPESCGKMLTQTAESMGFDIESLRLEIAGTCEHCRSNGT